jgi:hypothetical protein
MDTRRKQKGLIVTIWCSIDDMVFPLACTRYGDFIVMIENAKLSICKMFKELHGMPQLSHQCILQEIWKGY